MDIFEILGDSSEFSNTNIFMLNSDTVAGGRCRRQIPRPILKLGRANRVLKVRCHFGLRNEFSERETSNAAQWCVVGLCAWHD